MCFLDASNFKLNRFRVVLEFKLLSKMPFVRQQRLDGSGPEACCSCTRVHGNQRRRLAKLLRHQFGNGCSLRNGAGLCSAPGEALSKPSRCCKRINECCFSSFLSCLHLLPLHRSVGSPNFGVRSFSILLACLVMSLLAIILSVYCRPLSCVDNFWFICLPLGCYTALVAEIHGFACSLHSLFESCKCLVFDAGKVVNVSVITVITNAGDHQVNLLQSFCFLCLALATLSFHYGWVWSGRAAFVLPFVVVAVQGLRPDSAETLAGRTLMSLVGNLGNE